MKVAVIGLYAIKNAGDNILCECSQYLTRQIEPDVEIVEVDVNPTQGSFQGIDKIPFFISKVLIKISGYIFKYQESTKSRFRYNYEYFMWWLKINKKFKQQLSGVDAIIFAGGGFLKFRTQGLNYYVEQVVKIAEKNNIPIMMNGVGIEGYDDVDIRCQRLKKAINKDCMKVITTRDDIETLRDKYIVNPNTKISRVGDPALWTPECYNLTRNKDSKVIGINVIRGKVYQAYGNRMSEYELMNFYRKLVSRIDDEGWEWVLFSNGMKADQVFGKRLLMALGREDEERERLLPAPKNSVEFLNYIINFQCIFGARLHACITSYSLDVPVVGLIWNEKLDIFSKVIGKPKNYFKEDEMDIDVMIDTIRESFDSEYDQSIRNELKGLTKQYMEQFFEIIKK